MPAASKPKCVVRFTVQQKRGGGGQSLNLNKLDHAARFLSVSLPWKTPKRNPLCSPASRARWWQRDDISMESIQTALLKARKSYRRMAKLCHPDKGGEPDQWRRVQRAWQTVRDTFGRKGYRL